MRLPVLVLAGGEGRRMGGDKLAAVMDGKRLIDHALECARRWDAEPMIAARSDQALALNGVEMLADRAGLVGPLAGLAAGVEAAQAHGASRLLVIPADAPFLPNDLPQRLAAALEEQGAARCAIARSGARDHPTCSLWQVNGLNEAIGAYAATGRRSLIGLADTIGMTRAFWPLGEGPDPFANINTRADLAAAQAAIALHRR